MQVNTKRILFIPDLYEGGGSGAIVTQVLVKLFKEKGFTVAVLSQEFKKKKELDEVLCIPCKAFNGMANLKTSKYRKEFTTILEAFSPTHLFFDGSISNKPLCYLEEGIKRKLNITVFIFMQDFFCSKFYANDNQAPCTKCLDEGFLKVFTSTCGAKKVGLLKLAERCRSRYKLRTLLSKVNHVGTSTDEQIQFYIDFGISRNCTFKLPLPFDDSRLHNLESKRGDYFIGIAQNRIEKGFQFIPSILEHTSSKVILAYYDEQAVMQNLQKTGYDKFIKSGQLKLVAASWQNGLGGLVANSQGVLIPSIWPTTTEFGWLEALAMGKPTVAFDISAHHEYMRNYENGFISPLGDFEMMGKNMDYLSSLTDADYKVLLQNVKKMYAQLSNMDGWKIFIDKL